MGYRLSKIYTRTGDDGKTQFKPGERISKDHIMIECLGTIDELNCVIGMLLTNPIENHLLKTSLTQIQHNLFNVGGELCAPQFTAITAEKVSHVENCIDEWNTELPPLTEFILPNGNAATTTCHFARAVCRRAERQLVTLKESQEFSPHILHYINRLSDFLFVAARILMKEQKQQEVLWEHEK